MGGSHLVCVGFGFWVLGFGFVVLGFGAGGGGGPGGGECRAVRGVGEAGKHAGALRLRLLQAGVEV